MNARVQKLKQQIIDSMMPTKQLTALLPDKLATVLNSADATLNVLHLAVGLSEPGRKALTLVMDGLMTRDEETINVVLEAVLMWCDANAGELHRTIEGALHARARVMYARK